ncbi:MAG TPA: tetratricopeptide repeat protein [Drouetiella sp.]
MKTSAKIGLVGALLGFLVLPGAMTLAQDDAAWSKDLESAEKCFLAGDKVQSEKFYLQALSEVPDDTARATVINQKGVAQTSQHLYLDAQKSFAEALELRKKALGETDPTTLKTLSNLALATYKGGDSRAAEKLFLECLEKKRKVAPNSESIVKTLTNLANLYSDQRNRGDASKLYDEALSIDTSLFGEQSAAVATDQFNIGAMLQKCKEPKDALVHLDKALTIFTALGDKAGAVKALHYSALSNGDLNNFDKASELSLKALALSEEVKGKNHPDTIIHLLAAGDALFAAGENDEAEKMYLQARTTARACDPPSELVLTQCNLALAHLYRKEQKLDDAEQCYKKALVHYESLSKKDKRDLYDLPLAYSQLLGELKHSDESEHLQQKYLHVYAPDKAGK